MLKKDFSHLMSHSANDSFLFAVHLAVGVLDNFPFFPGYTKETIILCWGRCYWASLCPLHNESKILAGMRVLPSSPESPETQRSWPASVPLGENSSTQQRLGYNFLQWNATFFCFDLFVEQLPHKNYEHRDSYNVLSLLQKLTISFLLHRSLHTHS